MIIQEKMLPPLAEVEFEPLGQVARFVAEDGTDGEVEFLTAW